MKLNLARKECRRCGIIPEKKMSHGICHDCALTNWTIYNWSRYHNSLEYRQQALFRARERRKTKAPVI